MPTAQYTALANITLGSAAATVTFSSINQTYRDLMLVITPIATSSLVAKLNFNSDTTSTIFSERLFGNTTTANAANDLSSTYLQLGQTTQTTLKQSIIINFMDYSATDKHKTVLERINVQYIYASASRWPSTAAITQLVIGANTSTFAAGSTFALYGVK